MKCIGCYTDSSPGLERHKTRHIRPLVSATRYIFTKTGYLLCGDQDTAEHQQRRRPFVEELESPVVDRYRVDFQKTTGNFSHCSH